MTTGLCARNNRQARRDTTPSAVQTDRSHPAGTDSTELPEAAT